MSCETKLVLTEQAIGNIANMQRRIAEIGECCGWWGDEYIEALSSFGCSLAGMMRLGGRATAEDDLNLYVVSFIHYGVIFHRRYHADSSPDELVGTWSVNSSTSFRTAKRP